jgi:hypothetical protein
MLHRLPHFRPQDLEAKEQDKGHRRHQRREALDKEPDRRGRLALALPKAREIVEITRVLDKELKVRMVRVWEIVGIAKVLLRV